MDKIKEWFDLHIGQIISIEHYQFQNDNIHPISFKTRYGITVVVGPAAPAVGEIWYNVSSCTVMFNTSNDPLNPNWVITQ